MSVNEVKIRRAEVEFEVRGTGHPGSRTFAIGDEDHTLGNSLRHVLMQNASGVAFAGYSVPHPSEPIVHLRVQTARGSAGTAGDDDAAGRSRRGRSSRRGGGGSSMDVDGKDGGDDDDGQGDRMTAVDALKEACQTLIEESAFVLEKVEEAMPEVREDRLRMEQILGSSAGGQEEEEVVEEMDEDEDDE